VNAFVDPLIANGDQFGTLFLFWKPFHKAGGAPHLYYLSGVALNQYQWAKFVFHEFQPAYFALHRFHWSEFPSHKFWRAKVLAIMLPVFQITFLLQIHLKLLLTPDRRAQIGAHCRHPFRADSLPGNQIRQSFEV